MTKKLYTINEAAKFLRVTRQTIYNWRYQGLLESVKLGTRTLFTQEQLEKFIESCTVTG